MGEYSDLINGAAQAVISMRKEEIEQVVLQFDSAYSSSRRDNINDTCHALARSSSAFSNSVSDLIQALHKAVTKLNGGHLPKNKVLELKEELATKIHKVNTSFSNLKIFTTEVSKKL